MFLVFCVIFILLVAAVQSHASKKRMRDAVAKITGPYCVPLLGAIQIAFQLDPKNYLDSMMEHLRKNRKIMRVWIFNRLLIFSADLELNEQLLASQQHITKQQFYGMLKPWLGDGLLVSDGQKWHTRRKIITPTFHFKILEQFVEVFDQQSNIFVSRLEERADGKTPFDIFPYVRLVTLDIIAETAMGTKVHAQTNSDNAYASAVVEISKLMSWRFIRSHLSIDWIFTLLYPFLKRRQTQLIRILHDFTINVIEQRRQLLETTSTNDTPLVEVDDVGSKKRMALLDVLLQATVDGKPLSIEDIREEVDTFMFEGHDTTTSGISFALHLISRHPEVQNKILKEIKEVLGEDRNAPITLRQLNDLKYVECVIKESLRLYPPGPIIGRQLMQDFKYTHSKLGEGIIPAGTEFLMVLYGILHDPLFFDNPEDFLPERHEQMKEQSHAFSLIPFSAGPRNCIGQKYAMLEMKTTLAKMVRSYELLPLGEAVKPEMNLILCSSTGFHLGLKRRI